MTDITKYGAVGDGVTDCSPAIAKALETESELYFPAGVYTLTETMRIPSNRHIRLHENAVLFAADHCFEKAGTLAVITNADMENGNESIMLEGGRFAVVSAPMSEIEASTAFASTGLEAIVSLPVLD